MSVQSIRDFISWTLFGGIIGLLIGSFFNSSNSDINWILWGALVGLVVGLLGAFVSYFRHKKEQEKYKV